MTTEEVIQWLEDCPHLAGCRSEFAPSLCSCGKKDVIDSLYDDSDDDN